jgi:hypothetical protein
MTNYRFCRRRPHDAAGMIGTIEAAIRAQEPVSCILGHGPLKNRNNCPYPTADWAECLAYVQLMRLASAVKALYEPGLSITLYVDDARSQFANAVDAAVTQPYFDSLGQLVQTLGFDAVITDIVSLQELYPAFQHESFLPQATAKVAQWRQDPLNQEALFELYAHAHRNLVFPDTLSADEQHRLVDEATMRYQVCHEAEKLSGIWSQPNRVYMRYSPHEGFYQIFTLRKGSVSQPWQGQGALLLTPQGKLDPYIITTQKRQKTVLVDTFTTTFDLPGLNTLPVFRELETPTETSTLSETQAMFISR